MVQGSAAEALPRIAAERQVDLLVMGAVSRSRLREIFLGSTAERVLDHLPCDVLVIKAPDFREPLTVLRRARAAGGWRPLAQGRRNVTVSAKARAVYSTANVDSDRPAHQCPVG